MAQKFEKGRYSSLTERNDMYKPRGQGIRYYSSNNGTTTRRISDDFRSGKAFRREAAQKKVDRERRQAVANKRSANKRSAEIGGAVPGILSGVIGIAFCLIIIVPLFSVLLGGNDMTNYFDGKTNTIDSIETESGEPFYMFGATEKTETVKILNDDGEVEREYTFTSYQGDHVSMSDVYSWVDGLADNVQTYHEHPFIGSAMIFWNFVSQNLQPFVTGAFGDAAGGVIDSINDAIHGFVDGFTEWWDTVLGKGAGS